MFLWLVVKSLGFILSVVGNNSKVLSREEMWFVFEKVF